MAKVVTITQTFTRDQLIGMNPTNGKRHPYNAVVATNTIANKLLAAGVPIVGVLGIVAVEWGKLTVEHEDGLDGDEWKYTWTGNEVPKYWRKKMAEVGYRNGLDNPLAALIAADEDEL
jgi:hypothetical protein